MFVCVVLIGRFRFKALYLTCLCVNKDGLVCSDKSSIMRKTEGPRWVFLLDPKKLPSLQKKGKHPQKNAQYFGFLKVFLVLDVHFCLTLTKRFKILKSLQCFGDFLFYPSACDKSSSTCQLPGRRWTLPQRPRRRLRQRRGRFGGLVSWSLAHLKSS